MLWACVFGWRRHKHRMMKVFLDSLKYVQIVVDYTITKESISDRSTECRNPRSLNLVIFRWSYVNSGVYEWTLIPCNVFSLNAIGNLTTGFFLNSEERPT